MSSGLPSHKANLLVTSSMFADGSTSKVMLKPVARERPGASGGSPGGSVGGEGGDAFTTTSPTSAGVTSSTVTPRSSERAVALVDWRSATAASALAPSSYTISASTSTLAARTVRRTSAAVEKRARRLARIAAASNVSIVPAMVSRMVTDVMTLAPGIMGGGGDGGGEGGGMGGGKGGEGGDGASTILLEAEQDGCALAMSTPPGTSRNQTVCISTALAPERVRAMEAASAWLIPSFKIRSKNTSETSKGNAAVTFASAFISVYE